MNLSRASLISLILGSVLVAGMEGTHSATPSDRPGATRGSDSNSKIRLRRTVLKGQAALSSSVEDGTIREGTGSVRRRMQKKVQSGCKYPNKLTRPVTQPSGDTIVQNELKMVPQHNSDDWQATVEEIAGAFREAKKNKYRDACGAACKQCWNALGGQIDDVVFNLQRMTHMLLSPPWFQVSFCSADLSVCKSALDFVHTNKCVSSLGYAQYQDVTPNTSLCLPLDSNPNLFVLKQPKQQYGDTEYIAHSLETCKDDTITLNLDFRAKCATAFDFLGGDVVSVKASLDAAKELYKDNATGSQDYGVAFCPNGESKSRLQIRSVIEALHYLSWTTLNDECGGVGADEDSEECSQFVAENPWMNYWYDSTPYDAGEGPRVFDCDKLFL